MPLYHHGGAPHTKHQQRTKTSADTAVFEEAAGFEREIHTEPFNHRRWEQAFTTHTAGLVPAPTRGGTLSIGEGVARLRQLAGETYVQGALQEAAGQLESTREAALGALGESASQSDGADLMNTATEAAGKIAAALEAVQGFYNMCEQVAGRHS